MLNYCRKMSYNPACHVFLREPHTLCKRRQLPGAEHTVPSWQRAVAPGSAASGAEVDAGAGFGSFTGAGTGDVCCPDTDSGFCFL